jgi:hypothetical protein
MNILALDISSKVIKIALKVKDCQPVVFSDDESFNKADNLFFFLIGFWKKQK